MRSVVVGENLGSFNVAGHKYELMINAFVGDVKILDIYTGKKNDNKNIICGKDSLVDIQIKVDGQREILRLTDKSLKGDAFDLQKFIATAEKYEKSGLNDRNLASKINSIFNKLIKDSDGFKPDPRFETDVRGMSASEIKKYKKERIGINKMMIL